MNRVTIAFVIAVATIVAMFIMYTSFGKSAMKESFTTADPIDTIENIFTSGFRQFATAAKEGRLHQDVKENIINLIELSIQVIENNPSDSAAADPIDTIENISMSGLRQFATDVKAGRLSQDEKENIINFMELLIQVLENNPSESAAAAAAAATAAAAAVSIGDPDDDNDNDNDNDNDLLYTIGERVKLAESVIEKLSTESESSIINFMRTIQNYTDDSSLTSGLSLMQNSNPIEAMRSILLENANRTVRNDLTPETNSVVVTDVMVDRDVVDKYYNWLSMETFVNEFDAYGSLEYGAF